MCQNIISEQSVCWMQQKDFGKGQIRIVMAKWQGQSISEIARLMGCSWSAGLAGNLQIMVQRSDKPQNGEGFAALQSKKAVTAVLVKH